ncbi:MAG: radical SAM protein [Deltaproteobacteria bacterium]|nr:radical SAM protein [Deltaproteobacteria bacterium]
MCGASSQQSESEDKLSDGAQILGFSDDVEPRGSALATNESDLGRSTTQRKPQEWTDDKRWNPFNSYKLLAHVAQWKQIKRGKPIPAPVLITVDPTNVCNFNCEWCNAAYVRQKRKTSLSKEILLRIADFLPRWGEGNDVWEPGVKAICVAGGGEPLLNSATAPFIDRVIHNGVEVGMVTNGSRIINNIDSLSKCTWIGVSVDAATPETLNKLKGIPPGKDYFKRIITGISRLADYAVRHNNRLGFKHSAYGLSYKYLLYRDNIAEIYEAARLAKEIGCKNIHFRPASTTWDNIGTEKEISFTAREVTCFNEQMSRALELNDDNFNVYGVTHKFNSQFERSNCFEKCHSIFMTALIMPPVSKEAPNDSFSFGLCCDRRGDDKLELLQNVEDEELINKFWGHEEHWKIHDSIAVQRECPRCTYQPHNQIYEQVILNDSMTYKFI